MAMPVTMDIVLKDDSKINLQLPVEIWMQGAEHMIHVPTKMVFLSVIIDPDNKVPDSNRESNIWKGKGFATEMFYSL